MKIGELAKRTGIAPSAIRFYESRGLLKTVGRQANGYRDYQPDAVTVLTIIGEAQQAGFSLDEIKQLLPSDTSSWQHEQLIEALERKVMEITALEARLAGNRAHLQSLIALINARPDDMDCQHNAARVIAGLGIVQDD
jgi:DNA-binding transcriptional MerR regulator